MEAPGADGVRRTLLSETLALLYTREKQHERALSIYLTLRRPDVFALTMAHDLFAAVRDRVVQLMEVDVAQATDMLVHHTDRCLCVCVCVC